ncbi:lecithin retinol acyltransferase a [Menidia menidia]
MMQLLTFLVEKLSLFFKLRLFESSFSEREDRGRQVPRASHPPLRRGDLLEVPRTLFTHYGIYLGDNKVAHLIPDILPVLTNDRKLISSVITNNRLILGCVYKCASVRVDTLDDFAYGSSIVANCMDKVLATYCRYGTAQSRQTEKFCECLKSIIRDQRSVIITGLLGIMSIVFFGMVPETTLPTVLIPFTLWMAS